jgi:hypothetical protein
LNTVQWRKLHLSLPAWLSGTTCSKRGRSPKLNGVLQVSDSCRASSSSCMVYYTLCSCRKNMPIVGAVDWHSFGQIIIRPKGWSIPQILLSPQDRKAWKQLRLKVANNQSMVIIITSKYPVTEWQLCLGGSLKQ